MYNVKVPVPAVVKTTLDNMNLTERFLFDETAEDQEVYNAMVEIIMGEEITLVNSPETEKELRVSIRHRLMCHYWLPGPRILIA